MRKLGNIKLNQFSAVELDQRKMNALKGGCACMYGCGHYSCPNPCQCNDWLSGGINSANAYRYYEGLLFTSWDGESAY